MLKDTILGQIRHYLSTAGGGLIGAGIVTESDVNTVIGAVVTVVGIIWSALDKYLSGRIRPTPPQQ